MISAKFSKGLVQNGQKQQVHLDVRVVVEGIDTCHFHQLMCILYIFIQYNEKKNKTLKINIKTLNHCLISV